MERKKAELAEVHKKIGI